MIVRSLVVLLAVAVIAGCAGTGGGAKDKDLIQKRIVDFKTALLAKNIDGVMACVSDSFYHPEVGDKNAAKDLMKQGIDSGFVQDGEVDLTKMEIKFDEKDKNKASAYPITASASAGSVTVGLTLKKEGKGSKAAWMISEINVEGI
jgi:hypothetical protein